jgi:hypothetical protein
MIHRESLWITVREMIRKLGKWFGISVVIRNDSEGFRRIQNWDGNGWQNGQHERHERRILFPILIMPLTPPIPPLVQISTSPTCQGFIWPEQAYSDENG